MAAIMIQDNESLELYLRDLQSLELLSRKEEVELARGIREGDQKARDKLVSANLRFVVSIARGYQHQGMTLSDLISAGNMGLITAAERFDETQGFKFITYAVWWIRQAIHQSLAKDVRTVQLPGNRIDLLRKIARTSQKLQQDRGAEPEPEAIAEKLGVAVAMVQDTLMRAASAWSLDASFQENDDHSLLDVLVDHTQSAPDTEVVEGSVCKQVEVMLNTLSPRDAEVLRLYFGLRDEEPLTLGQIGLRFNVSRERVRQIKEKALRRLRHPKHRRLLALLMEPS